MRIIYTNHARQRMKQRKVTEQQVEETLTVPDRLESGDNGGDIAIREYDGREVHVIFKEKEEDVYLVFTVIKPRIR
jgi:hypothetical protein